MHKFIAYDDLEYNLRDNEVLAEQIEILVFAGHAVELDLTPRTAKEALDIPLGKLLEMGRPVAAPRKMKTPDGPPRKRRSGEVRAQYIAGLTVFARERDLPLPPEPVQLRHVRQSVLDKYDAYLATQVR